MSSSHPLHLPSCPTRRSSDLTGASGTAGAREAKGSPPDGYTLYAVHDYIHSTYYTGVADVAYTDFEPICSVSNTPSVLTRSEEHTSELQSPCNIVCRLLLVKK